MAEARVHPTAVVAPGAELASGVEVGPYAVVGSGARLGAGVRLHAHVVIEGHTELGDGVEVFPFAALGARPQDKKYDGSETRVRVGDGSVVREYVTIHPGAAAGGETVVGRNVLIMAYCHVAHDVRIGDGVTMANATQLAGHCVVEDGAVLGGLTNVHQFARIGRLAMTGAATRVSRDVLPFSLVDGHPARWVGLNVVGLERAGVSEAARRRLKLMLRRLFAGGWAEGLAAVEAMDDAPEGAQLLAFIEGSRRGITRPRRRTLDPRGGLEPAR